MKHLIFSIVISLFIYSFCFAKGTDIKMRNFGKNYNIYATAGEGESICGGSLSIRVLLRGQEILIDGTIVKRNGFIQDWWVSDINGDEQPEIFVWVRSCGSGSLGKLYSYTFDGNRIHNMNIARPDKDLTKGYRGNDVYQIEEDGIIRKFPRYDKKDSNAKSSLGTTTLKYLFNEKKWIEVEPGVSY